MKNFSGASSYLGILQVLAYLSHITNFSGRCCYDLLLQIQDQERLRNLLKVPQPRNTVTPECKSLNTVLKWKL